MPEISIIIRTFNEERSLGDLLLAIKSQSCRDYEIIIVDSGSSDKTLEIAGEFADYILQIENRDFTFGYSLNLGCKQARGKYLVFVSAHILPVDADWLQNLIEPFKNEKVAMVYGRQIGNQETKFSEKRDFQRIFGKTAFYPNNANAAIRRDLWQKHSFDEYLFGLEDIEWSKRVAKEGFLTHYEPKASVYHIHHEKWPQIFNRYRREAIAAARIGLDQPLYTRIGFFYLILGILKDFLASLPEVSLSRFEEIVRFRYLQWKGTRQGWLYDREVDLNRDKYALFYPSINRAVVIKNKYQAKIEDIPLPETKPGDILVKVEYVGVCRTDLEVYEGTLGYYRDGVASYPIVPGHEFSGTIVKIGASNKYREVFKIGERVIGECILSKGGNSQRQEVGVINYNGAYSQFIVMPGQYLHPIPEELDLKTACLAEPLAVVLRSLRRAKFSLVPGSEAAVIGAGPIGNLISQVLAQRGFSVTVFDKNQARLDYLRNKVKAISQRLGDLDRFAFIVEATGSADVLKMILNESKLDATMLLLGFPYGNLNYNFEDIVGKEKTVIGSVGGEREDFQEALKILPKLDTVPFIGNVLPLENFKQAWEIQKKSKQLKIILKI
ncbi:MAG: glycosyltransferase [Candidatus Nealsonbacteria bacterium]